MFMFTLSSTLLETSKDPSVGELVDGRYRIKFDYQSELNIIYLTSSTSFVAPMCFAGTSNFHR